MEHKNEFKVGDAVSYLHEDKSMKYIINSIGDDTISIQHSFDTDGTLCKMVNLNCIIHYGTENEIFAGDRVVLRHGSDTIMTVNEVFIDRDSCDVTWFNNNGDMKVIELKMKALQKTNF